MSASKNSVFIIGNLGQAPEVRTGQDGKKVVSLSLATSEKWTDAKAEPQQATTWHRVVIFNKNLADVAEKYLKAGAKVGVEGKLQTRKWTDKDNIERYATEIVLGQYTGNLMMLNGGGASHNEAILIGNLGGDPQVRFTQDNRKIVSFSVATSEKWTDKASKAKKEKTEWHNVTIFNEHYADVAGKYLKKGSTVLVQGKITVEKYTTANDQTERYSTKIVVSQFNGTLELYGDSKAGQAPSEDAYGTVRDVPQNGNQGWEMPPDSDDEIPF